MTSVDLDELERLALAATPGPWIGFVLGGQSASDFPAGWRWASGSMPRYVAVDKAQVLSPEDGAFIATCTPDAILSLITALRDGRGKALEEAAIRIQDFEPDMADIIRALKEPT